MAAESEPRPERPILRTAVPAAAMGALLILSFFMVQRAPVEWLTGPLFAFFIPFSIGGLIVALTGNENNFSIGGCLLWPLLMIPIGIAGAIVLNEASACIAMASLVWLVAGLGGWASSSWLRWQRKRWEAGKDAIYSAAWLALPMTMALFVEPVAKDDYRIVSRSVVIQASADAIWPKLLSIENVSPNEGRWNFTQNVIGIPRPTSAKLVSRDGEWVREARWGKDIRFEEVITSVTPDQDIRWRFRFPDDSISRYTDRHIHPDSEMLTVESGGYRLEPAGPGLTRVTLWTSYRQKVRLPSYTAWWGERYLGDVQDNVLSVIKGRVEA